ncbi:hypothetical protein BDV98DRAFT_602195 [Pterulicium gracile]|uniref:Phosphogluconate dehydrogenase NAD-binding putative C-terminal domain-containing protein n=1 Tax=Pterulicium gracile TaxID=1884261 RepID=A0A5C3QVF6_9AGAR|nr:hypothetical protein BDV98DRAFT_602195 [Pterula gracilis]
MATVSNQALKVAIVATGSVDAALGHRLTAAGRTIFTDLPNRSEETGRRALDASMQDRDLDYIVANSDLFMSVVPPRDSTILAETIQEKLRASLAHGRRDDKRRLVYVEANATSPDTVQHVSELFSGMEGVGFLSACIIGGPPEGDYDPTMSGRKEDLEILQKLGTLGLKIKVMQGKKAGIAPHAPSPATAQALLEELNESQRLVLQRITKSVPPMSPKAYRWVGEMEEIEEFIRVGGGQGEIFSGMAKVYASIERSMSEEGGGQEVTVLEDFVKAAKEELETLRE